MAYTSFAAISCSFLFPYCNVVVIGTTRAKNLEKSVVQWWGADLKQRREIKIAHYTDQIFYEWGGKLGHCMITKNPFILSNH